MVLSEMSLTKIEQIRLKMEEINVHERELNLKVRQQQYEESLKVYEKTETEVMLDIAREDLLNPLYEQVVKEYDEAKLWMDRCHAKLKQAVKLTDNEELLERMGKAPTPDDPMYPSMDATAIIRKLRAASVRKAR